jgi:hypothetical protein
MLLEAAVAAVYDRRRSESATSSPVIDRRYRIGLIIGALVFSAITLGLLVYWGENTVGIVAASDMNPLSYFMAQTRIVYTYLRLLFFPYPQSLEYEFPAAVGILP